MQRANEQTTHGRTLAGAVLSLVMPSLFLGQVFYWFDRTDLSRDGLAGAAAFAVISPVFGALFGWPYLLPALMAWVVLDRIQRHYAWTAALVGLATGTSLASLAFRDGRFFGTPIAYPLCIGVGLLTGLGVWWIAYGRQGELAPVARPRAAGSCSEAALRAVTLGE